MPIWKMKKLGSPEIGLLKIIQLDKEKKKMEGGTIIWGRLTSEPRSTWGWLTFFVKEQKVRSLDSVEHPASILHTHLFCQT